MQKLILPALEHFNNEISCRNSVTKNLSASLGEGANAFSVHYISLDPCKSSGNMIGFYFESVSFAMEHNTILYKNDLIRRCSYNQKLSQVHNLNSLELMMDLAIFDF
jgi:hypothetical protein